MIKALVKNRITSVMCGVVGRSKGGTVKKASKGRVVAFAVLYLYLVIFFFGFSVSMSSMLGAVLIGAGADWAYFAIFMIVSVSLLFIFSIFETKTELFECKDNDLLLSMPIKPRDIVLSRISVVLLYNYVIQAVIMLPCIIVYAIYSHNIVGIIGITLISFFLPLFATSLASGVGYLTALIAKRLRRKSFITVVIAVAFLLLYFFGYSYLMEGFENLVEAGPDGITITQENAPLLYAIGSAGLINPASFAIIIVLSVISAAVALFVISKSYINVVTDSRSAAKAKYKGELSGQKSIITALSIKEFSRFTSSATYMLNSALGVLFEIILGVLAIVQRSKIIAMISQIAEGQSASEFIAPIMIAFIFLISSVTMISASALSLEGKNLWIIKSLPVKDRDVLIAKTVPHIVVSSVASLITSILFMIAISAPIKYWIFFILTPIAANLFSAFFGLVINVQFPKFDYQNEAQPVKQSIPVFLVMTVQMFLGLGVLIGNFILSLIGFGIIAAIVTFLLFSALAIVFLIVLLGHSARKYSSYEV